MPMVYIKRILASPASAFGNFARSIGLILLVMGCSAQPAIDEKTTVPSPDNRFVATALVLNPGARYPYCAEVFLGSQNEKLGSRGNIFRSTKEYHITVAWTSATNLVI